MYVEGPLPLYMSYVSPDQTKRDWHLETFKAARDKGQLIQNLTKGNENKQWQELLRIEGWICYVMSIIVG